MREDMCTDVRLHTCVYVWVLLFTLFPFEKYGVSLGKMKEL